MYNSSISRLNASNARPYVGNLDHVFNEGLGSIAAYLGRQTGSAVPMRAFDHAFLDSTDEAGALTERYSFDRSFGLRYTRSLLGFDHCRDGSVQRLTMQGNFISAAVQ